MWIITNLEPERGLEIYQQRMKIEEAFRDLKSLLGMGRVMNWQRELMEKTLALIILAYVLGLLTGELLRDLLYGGGLPSTPLDAFHPPAQRSKQWYLYSGFFILLKKKVKLSQAKWRQLSAAAYVLFQTIVLTPT